MKPLDPIKNQRFSLISLPKNDGKNRYIRYDGPMVKIETLPIGHSLVETQDGSYTLFSEAFGEACHSIGGAKSETILHYINGCKIPEKAKEKNITILEVGFGLGIGFLTTLEEIKTPFTFISVELDKNLLNWFKDHHPELELSWDGNLLKGKTKSFDLIIIQGDARIELPRFLKNHPVKWDAIYQDAFSPKRNPILWTKEWFEFLKTHSEPDVILSTYSASNSIRKSLHDAGWGVHRGDMFGPKRTSTRAYLNQPTDPVILDLLLRSPVSAITDKGLGLNL